MLFILRLKFDSMWQLDEEDVILSHLFFALLSEAASLAHLRIFVIKPPQRRMFTL